MEHLLGALTEGDKITNGHKSDIYRGRWRTPYYAIELRVIPASQGSGGTIVNNNNGWAKLGNGLVIVWGNG